MKRFLILTFMITALGCSSTGGIKIVSPSTPENEAKEEIRKAPVTKLETSSQPPARHEATGPREAAAEGTKVQTTPGQTTASPLSIKSPYTLEALINLLEKKGVIHEEELLEEIKRLEMK